MAKTITIQNITLKTKHIVGCKAIVDTEFGDYDLTIYTTSGKAELTFGSDKSARDNAYNDLVALMKE
jgi:hypothetical protein